MFRLSTSSVRRHIEKLKTIHVKIFSTTEYFHKIQNKCNSKDRQHFYIYLRKLKYSRNEKNIYKRNVEKYKNVIDLWSYTCFVFM
jgi:hypothetical protein